MEWIFQNGNIWKHNANSASFLFRTNQLNCKLVSETNWFYISLQLSKEVCLLFSLYRSLVTIHFYISQKKKIVILSSHMCATRKYVMIMNGNVLRFPVSVRYVLNIASKYRKWYALLHLHQIELFKWWFSIHVMFSFFPVTFEQILCMILIIFFYIRVHVFAFLFVRIAMSVNSIMNCICCVDLIWSNFFSFFRFVYVFHTSKNILFFHARQPMLMSCIRHHNKIQ